MGILLCCLLLAVTASGQSPAKGRITGTIEIKDNGKKMEGASILLKRVSDSLYHTAISNENGRFSFDNLPDGQYVLIVTYLGARKYISEAPVVIRDGVSKDLPVITVMMNEDRMLKEVEIRDKKVFAEQQIDKTVINVDALISARGGNVMDVLNNAPAVTINEEGGISLKGKSGVTVFIDGRQTFMTGKELAGYLKSLPADMIEKVEIMSNPPARYNADGNGGIINIRTRKIRAKGINGNISLNYGQGVYPRSNNAVSVNYRNDRLNVFGSAGYTLLNNFFDSDRRRLYSHSNAAPDYLLQQAYYEKSNKKTTNYKFGVDYDIDKRTSIGLVLNGFSSPYKERGRYVNTFGLQGSGPDSVMYVASRLKEQTRNNAFSVVLHHQQENGDREWNIGLDYLDYHTTSEQYSVNDTYVQDSTLSNRFALWTDNPFKAKIYSGKADIVLPVPGGIKMSAGVQVLYSRRNSSGNYEQELDNELYPLLQLNNRFRYDENINSLYVSFQKRVSRLALQAGLRMENTQAKARQYDIYQRPDSSFRMDYTNLFPTIYLSYDLDSTAGRTLVLSAGRRITRPNYQDLNPSVFFYDRYTSVTGNAVLRPGYATNLELAYNHGNAFSTGVSYTRTSSGITQVYRQENASFIASSMNIDRITGIGVNISTSLPITDWWMVNLYSELTSTRYQGQIFTDEYLDNSYTTFRLSGNSQLQFGKGWGGEISGLYRSGMIVGQAILKPVWQMHMAVQKKMLKDKATINLAVRDIFYSWNVRRDLYIRHAEVYFSNRFDTRLINVTFTYKIGKTWKARSYKSGIQSEESRLEGR